jgi:hypothetical protein
VIAPPPDLDPTTLLGDWHILATTLSFWRGKRRPVATYEALPGPGLRWADALRYEQRGWLTGRWTTRRLAGFDTGDPAAPGRFLWRGAGALAVLTSTWAFVAVAPDRAWAATWFSAATFGITPEGMDVYARDADLDPTVVDGVVATLSARPEFAHIGGWFRPGE